MNDNAQSARITFGSPDHRVQELASPRPMNGWETTVIDKILSVSFRALPAPDALRAVCPPDPPSPTQAEGRGSGGY